jgi:hypothetical protein
MVLNSINIVVSSYNNCKGQPCMYSLSEMTNQVFPNCRRRILAGAILSQLVAYIFHAKKFITSIFAYRSSVH